MVDPRRIGLRLLLLGGVLLCRIEGASGGSGDFESRRLRLLDVVSREADRSLFPAAARLAVKKETATAFRILDSLARDQTIGGMFYAYSMIGTYLHFRAVLPDSLHRAIRHAFRRRTMYRGDTENHWVMYYTGMYLAAQTWPGEDGTQWFNGRSSEENFREANAWLNHWMRITTTIGQGEFDSPTYSTIFLAPMTVLYEFAGDTLMKRKAQMMLDLLFADFAAEHLKGSYGGGHSRDYPDDIVNPLSAPATMWAWLYFGFPQFEVWSDSLYRPRNRTSWESLFGVLSSYRLPEIIRAIATDRAVPYVHRETKRVRNVIRSGEELNPPVFKYTYMTKDFVLGSLQGGILQPIQQHTWDVTFVSDRPNNTVFTLHPYYAGSELAMFFPEEQKFMVSEVDRYHLIYTNPDKWNSSSPFEKTFQHKNTIIVLYDIAPGAKHSHIDGFFPKTLDRRIVHPSGWVFCKGGSTYIALFPLKGGDWIDEAIDWRFRSHALRNGIVVEVFSADEFSSFEEFMRKMGRRTVDTTGFSRTLSLAYTTLRGDSLQFRYDGGSILNGKAVGFASYRLFSGPFINADVGSGVITLMHGGRKRVLDFPSVRITENE